MICLGIESTAHTFGIGIVDENGKILANEKDVYIPPTGKGIVPNEAKEHHEKVKEEVLNKALETAGLNLKDIDLIAYAAGPGLPPCLLVGANFAEKIGRKKKIVKVNHAVAHVEIGKLKCKLKDPVIVYLSGGNTQIVSLIEKHYRVFGETLDIPIGNCLDVVARAMGYPMPGGKYIEELAKKGKWVELPYCVKGMDVSFSGIATKAIELLEKGKKKEDIAFSLQETCFAMLTEVTERALAHTAKKEVLLVGGVASNKRLQIMMKIMCKERGARCKVVPQEFAQDNGAMIAWTGILAFKHAWSSIKNKINPNWRIDEVKIKF
jgi:universal protein Kae1